MIIHLSKLRREGVSLQFSYPINPRMNQGSALSEETYIQILKQIGYISQEYHSTYIRTYTYAYVYIYPYILTFIGNW